MKHLILDQVSIHFQTDLINNLSLNIAPGWMGISGPNGCGKTTLARYIHSQLCEKESISGCSGYIEGPDSSLYVSQFAMDGNTLPQLQDLGNVSDIMYSSDNYIRRIMSMLQIKDDWLYRLDELSFGELRRLHLSIVLSRMPDVLILDEPENHLDRFTQSLIADVLAQFTGIGIIIGHNREIMNRLCTSTLLIYQGNCHYFSTDLSGALDLYHKQQERILLQRKGLQNQIRTEKLLLTQLKGNAAKAKKALSKKGVSDPDAKTAIDMARMGGADKTSGRKVKVQKKHIEDIESKLNNLSADTRIKTGLTARGKNAKRDRFLHIDEGLYRVNPGLCLSVQELNIRPGEKIALIGNNGCGKTSLITYIIQNCLKPENVGFKWRFVSQELSNEEIAWIKDEYNAAADKERGEIMAYFSRLGGDAQRQHELEKASPGELRKLLFSQLFLEDIELMILDEPCNHMDIFAVEVIEEALTQYEGAVLFISHDIHFIKSVANKYMTIENGRVTIKTAI